VNEQQQQKMKVLRLKKHSDVENEDWILKA
jgi:hypothetical protein